MLPTSPIAEIIDGTEGSDRQIGTDVSKLDLGLSDQEDKPASANDQLDRVEGSQGSQRNREKKKGFRDNWITV